MTENNEGLVNNPEEELTPGLTEILSTFPDSPSDAKIEQWKEVHGEIFCSGFSETELIVWRPIHRQEFVKLQESMQSAGSVSTFDLEEHVVSQCLLWASPTATMSLDKKAGSLSTLNEQIMQNSNFISPQVAAALVVKL